jgi:hypothetical protein
VKVELWGKDGQGLFEREIDLPAVPRLGDTVYLPRHADSDPDKFRVAGVAWHVDENDAVIVGLKLQST